MVLVFNWENIPMSTKVLPKNGVVWFAHFAALRKKMGDELGTSYAGTSQGTNVDVQ